MRRYTHCSCYNGQFYQQCHSSTTNVHFNQHSSTPVTKTGTSTANLHSIAALPPGLQQQFFSLMQQYISNAALPPNLSPAPDYNDSNVPTSMLPLSVNAATLTFTQASTTNAPCTKLPVNVPPPPPRIYITID